MVTYIGNGAYCYANTTAMLLASVGEVVSPSLVEVLSGVGLGCQLSPSDGEIYFSTVAPDVGVSKALDLLGFGYEERSSDEDGSFPLGELRAALDEGAVALGPLDMRCLTYRPRARGPSGGDHFVLAYAADDSEVHVHDPAGFPHVSLPLADLERAWRAELIGYRRGAFRYWFAPRRLESVSDGELFERALAWFASIYAVADVALGEAGRVSGPHAVRACAEGVRTGDVSPEQAGHVTGFVFQLGAKRALDYAAFFEGRRLELAALKRRQAEWFGRAHTLAVRAQWPAVAAALDTIAEIEEELGAALSALAPRLP